MFRLNLGPSARDGASRRDFLQLGVAGLAAVGLPELLRAKEASAGASKVSKGTSVILLWLDGGPSHIDMYDMKPDAPAEYRGLWKPIRTKVPGFDITELYPKQAKLTDKFSMVRSLHHDTGDHFAGAHRMITTKDMGVSGANTPGKFPGIGAIVNREIGARVRGMPAQAHLAKHPSAGAMDRFGEEAFEFVTGPQARRAFDIGKEDVRLRDRYGRNSFGQSALLARRLVEAGSTFVTVHSGGWDHHWDLKESYERMLPMVDAAVASLFEDLDDRGLLETTLVVLCGEFGRTPKMNDGGNGGAPMSKGTPGRDHWGDAMFCLMGGGGVKGGRVIGSTDRLGRRPHTGAVSPSNIHATIYRVLGIDPKLQLLEPGGRPVNVLDDPKPIDELL
jgi:hypothetical protein